MATKVAVLGSYQALGDEPIERVSKNAARVLVRRLLAERINPFLIRMKPTPKPCLRAIDFLPRRSGPYIPENLPPAEVNGCIFEDPSERTGKTFWLLAARKFVEAC